MSRRHLAGPVARTLRVLALDAVGSAQPGEPWAYPATVRQLACPHRDLEARWRDYCEAVNAAWDAYSGRHACGPTECGLPRSAHLEVMEADCEHALRRVLLEDCTTPGCGASAERGSVGRPTCLAHRPASVVLVDRYVDAL